MIPGYDKMLKEFCYKAMHLLFISLPDEHVRWITAILSVSKWLPLCVIQAFIANTLTPPDQYSIAAQPEQSFLHSSSVTPQPLFMISPIAASTPLGCIVLPLRYKNKANTIVFLFFIL